MTNPESFRKEYLARIHRAQDWIERHLGEDLALEEIAREACFSPFHFHRIFTTVTGESLYQFILRLRVERAAAQLCQNEDVPVSQIALDLGFSSASTFARAFQAQFGLSASEFRKKCKADSKQWKDSEFGNAYLVQTVESTETRKKIMNAMPHVRPTLLEVRALSATTVAYVRHIGPYAGDNDLFKRLFGQIYAWAGPRGFLQRPGTEMLCVYHDNPEITEDDKLRLSVGITVPVGTATQAPLATMEIGAGKYVCARFELLNHEYPAAWGYVMGEWMPASGYQPDDRPCYEAYLNDPATHPEGRCVVEIRCGIKSL